MNNNLEIYALLTGSGIGTKPLQSFLDGHPKIITIPGYPLVYFYPHWKHWEETLNEWSWDSIVKIFTERHPGQKCERCWHYFVAESNANDSLNCQRCQGHLQTAGE